MAKKVIRKFGWRPDLPDFRDNHYSDKLMHKVGVSAPIDVDLRPLLPPVYDQGPTSSCGENAGGFAFVYAHHAQGLPVFMPSRLFMYYNVRSMEGTVRQADAGSEIRDVIKTMVDQGVPDETLWPFQLNRVLAKPPQEVYDAALKHKALTYSRVPVAEKNVCSVVSHKLPVIIGVTLYESFMSDAVAKTGIVPMPQTTEKVIGGHAMAIVGMSLKDRMFIVRNSWSSLWGDSGYCHMPFDYVLNPNLSDDFWCLWMVKK
jgi:hypothetical protein